MLPILQTFSLCPIAKGQRESSLALRTYPVLWYNLQTLTPRHHLTLQLNRSSKEGVHRRAEPVMVLDVHMVTEYMVRLIQHVGAA